MHTENHMVNTQLFQTLKGQLLPQATAQNLAGAPAYTLSRRWPRRWNPPSSPRPPCTPAKLPS
jgi:hypothetical protein